jgi:hypothetical protein
MSPWQLFIILIAGTITGLIGWAIGRRAGSGSAGWWLGFLLSLLGIVLIIVIVLTSPAAREEAKVRKEADRLRIQQEAQRRAGYPQQGPYPPQQPYQPEPQQGPVPGPLGAWREARREDRDGG